MKPLATEKTAPELKGLKVLVRHMDYLRARLAEAKAHMEGVGNPLVAASIEEMIRHYGEQIAALEDKIDSHIDTYPGLKQDVELLKSIPGISDATARIILCEAHAARDEDGKLSRKAQTAHAGLAPVQRQSGTSVKGKTRLCKTGNRRLRRGLYMPAVCAIKCNPVIRKFYNRLVSNGKRKMAAVVASMRKLLVIAIGVLNNKVPFDQNWEGQKMA
jgi:transposase